MRMFACVSATVLLVAVTCIQAGERKVKVVTGKPLPTVKVGDIVRITQSGAAGKTEISVKVVGPAKLVGTNDIDQYTNGEQMIGAVTKEFEIQAEKKGKAKITITINDVIAKKSETSEIELDIE